MAGRVTSLSPRALRIFLWFFRIFIKTGGYILAEKWTSRSENESWHFQSGSHGAHARAKGTRNDLTSIFYNVWALLLFKWSYKILNTVLHKALLQSQANAKPTNLFHDFKLEVYIRSNLLCKWCPNLFLSSDICYMSQ